VHDFLTIAAPAPLQAAGVAAMGMGPDYYTDLARAYRERRDLRAQLVAAESELARARERERTHREETERLADTIAKLRADLDWVVPEMERLKALTASVWASASWRLTRPLRAVKGLRPGR